MNDELPKVTETVILDAKTQPGYSFQSSRIILDGSLLTDPFDSDGNKLPVIVLELSKNTSGSEISGLTIGGIASTFSVGIYTLDSGGLLIFKRKNRMSLQREIVKQKRMRIRTNQLA